MIGQDGTVYLQSYSGLADTHWFGTTCVPCGRVHSISIPAAIHLAATAAALRKIEQKVGRNPGSDCAAVSAAMIQKWHGTAGSHYGLAGIIQPMNAPSMSEPPYALLHGLRDTVVGEVRIGNDLTLRVMAVMLIVYLTDDPQTVRGLAQHLSVSKTVITNAFDRLTELGLVRRRVDPADRRSVHAVRTEAGWAMVARLKASLAAAADGPG
jgi:DNA-binding MarR family transcriptional regulator